MIVEFDVEMTVAKIYDFMLKHAFSTWKGLSGEIAGLVLLVGFFITGNLLLFCFGLLAMIYIPLTIYLKAKKQMEQASAHPNKIHYIISEHGIAILAGDKKQFQSWSKLYKVVSTGKSIIVYTDEMNACILPKEDMGLTRKTVMEFIYANMSKERVQLS
ncbi:MAG: YcxB family protein [Mobilitalea sp.]